MAWVAKAVVVLLVFVSGFGAGYVFRGWRGGLDVDVSDAHVLAQQNVDAGALAHQRVIESWNDAKTAEHRVRVIERTIEVDRGCPPGRGAVSPDVARELRDVLEARASAR